MYTSHPSHPHYSHSCVLCLIYKLWFMYVFDTSNIDSDSHYSTHPSCPLLNSVLCNLHPGTLALWPSTLQSTLILCSLFTQFDINPIYFRAPALGGYGWHIHIWMLRKEWLDYVENKRFRLLISSIFVWACIFGLHISILPWTIIWKFTGII